MCGKKNLKSIVKEKNAISEVFAVILLIAVVVVIAGAAYFVIGGMNSGLSPSPYVSMIQTHDYISIVDIQNGPIPVTHTTIYIINSTGVPPGVNGTLHTGGSNVAGGDYITLSGTVPGETYKVRLIYRSSLAGAVRYVAP